MFNVLADSSDDNWEKRISTGLMDKAEASDFFWLGSTDSSFIAIFNRHKGEEEKCAAIILHSVGGHADWPEVVSPLRNMLPEFGWATLSIQLPLISPEKNKESKPGIYILYAVPDETTINALPVRRIFCRPKVYC